MPLIPKMLSALKQAQQELSALTTAKPARVPFPDAPGALTVYHGSPHNFEKFDFENNLRKGEGNMTYGPGGYLTGNRPLAEQYANKLANSEPITTAGPLAGGNLAMQRGLKQDPEAMLSWLQAQQFLRARESSYRPHMIDKNTINAKSSAGRADNHVNVEAYDDELRNRMSKYEALNNLIPYDQSGFFAHNPITQNSLQQVLSQGQLLKGMPSPVLSWTRDVKDPSGLTVVSPASGVVNNLRSLAAAQAGIKGPKYSAGLSSEHRLDFSKLPDLANWDGEPLVIKPISKANLYQTQLNASPNDMLLYDQKFSDQSPGVQGALSALAERFGAKVDSEGTGRQVLDWVPQNAKGMRAMSEAGIPATAYLRGGKPRNSIITDIFNPEDYNFVIHNQELLDMLQRTSKKVGGRV